MTSSSKILIDVEGGNNMLYLPLDQMIQRGGSTASGSVQELRDLANRIAPYLSAPSGTNAVDRSRLTTSGRGAR
jgi:membrane protease subunit HflK